MMTVQPAMRWTRRPDEEMSFGETMRFLASWRQDGPCVSLLCPTQGVGSRGDPIQLRGLLRESREQIEAAGISGPAVEHLLDPAEDLLGRDPAFWHHQQEGLAIFLSPTLVRWMSVPLRVPERVMVAERFHVRPLLALMVDEHPYLVLALSQNRVRLLRAHRGVAREIQLPQSASGMASALGYDDLQKQNRYHTGERFGRRQPPIHHGQGIGGEIDKIELARYFEVVADSVRDALRGEQAPMVLAGDAYELAIYRKANKYAHVTQDEVRGSPDRVPDRELCERARPEVLPALLASLRKQQERYRRLTGTRRWSSDLAEIVREASNGVIDALFVDPNAMAWGRVDPRSSRVELHAGRMPGDAELFDLATDETLRQRGKVFPVDGADAISAALRVPQP